MLNTSKKIIKIIPYLLKYGFKPFKNRHKILKNTKKNFELDKILESQYYSQNGQDKYLLEGLFSGKKNGFFIDIGANDGITFSNTYALERLGWNGVCVEPHPEVFSLLRQNRACECICAAVMGKNSKESIDFWKINSDAIGNSMLSGFPKFMNAFQKKRIRKLLDLKFITMENISVEKICIAEYIYKKRFPQIDIICIDVEGAERNVIEDLLGNQIYPKVFCIENNNMHYTLCYEMHANGYILDTIIGGDEIYLKESK